MIIAGVTKEMMQGSNIFVTPVSITENDPIIRRIKEGKYHDTIFGNAENARSFYKVCFDVNGSVLCGLGIE